MTDNPYAAPDHGVDRHAVRETSLAGGDFVYMGFWKRVLASIIDNVLLGIACLPLMFMLYQIIEKDETAELTYNLLSSVVSIVVVLLFWQFKQSTPGKMIFSARIVDAQTYGKPSFGKLVIRYLGYIPSTLVLFLGFIWVAFDKQKRGWHDMMAGTLVVSPKPLSERRATRTVRKPPAPPAA
jgi:uncharacterized RDD family membrane protein YckC